MVWTPDELPSIETSKVPGVKQGKQCVQFA